GSARISAGRKRPPTARCSVTQLILSLSGRGICKAWASCSDFEFSGNRRAATRVQVRYDRRTTPVKNQRLREKCTRGGCSSAGVSSGASTGGGVMVGSDDILGISFS